MPFLWRPFLFLSNTAVKFPPKIFAFLIHHVVYYVSFAIPSSVMYALPACCALNTFYYLYYSHIGSPTPDFSFCRIFINRNGNSLSRFIVFQIVSRWVFSSFLCTTSASFLIQPCGHYSTNFGCWKIDYFYYWNGRINPISYNSLMR